MTLQQGSGWLRQTAADRGLPQFTIAQANAFLQAASSTRKARLRELVRKVASGLGRDDVNVRRLAAFCRTIASQTGSAPNSPVIAAPRREHKSSAAPHSVAKPKESVADRPHGFHVYAAKGALTFELDTTRAHKEIQPQNTIRIEGAPAVADGYDWGRKKISFQLAVAELPILLATLMGWSPEAQFKFHGADNRKALEVRSKADNTMMVLKDGSALIAVPLKPGDLFTVVAMVTQAMQLNHPHLTSDSVLMVAKRCAVTPSSGGVR